MVEVIYRDDFIVAGIPGLQFCIVEINYLCKQLNSALKNPRYVFPVSCRKEKNRLFFHKYERSQRFYLNFTI